MRYLAGFVAVAALSLSSTAQPAAGQVTLTQGASAEPRTAIAGSSVNRAQAQISGKVIGPGGNPIADVTVRARDLVNSQIGGSTSTAASGQFAVNVNPGSYVLEVVDAGGQIIGTSPFISAAAGTAVASATITATSGALSVSTTGGLVSTLTSTAARSVTYAAAAAGVAGVVTPGNVVTASPSR
jgi:Carboxypeptidase regulatory-like domain